MVKPEWGTKRTCPKCGTRFYDLGKDDPVTCIECDEQWVPEPVLKSKQPMPFDEKDDKKKDDDDDLAADDLEDVEDDDGGSADDDVDLDTGDADIKVVKDDDGDDDN